MNTNSSPRIQPVLLASVVSALAAVVAVVGHVVLGLGETPLVIGTLVASSVIGWINAEPRHHTQVTPLPGGHPVADLHRAA